MDTGRVVKSSLDGAWEHDGSLAGSAFLGVAGEPDGGREAGASQVRCSPAESGNDLVESGDLFYSFLVWGGTSLEPRPVLASCPKQERGVRWAEGERCCIRNRLSV